MQVTLYEFVKRENSTKRPTDSTPSEITGCVLKDATSIIHPTLVFTGLGNPTRFNYLYIEELGGRYYFIEDWVSVRNRWECSCTVDVLASFKPEIGDSTEYVLRSSAERDISIVDTAYPTHAIPRNSVSRIKSPLHPGPNGINSGSYVIGVITGDSNAYGAVGYYVFTPNQFRQLVDNLYSDSIIEDAQNFDLVKAQTNPIQYIVSAKWFPEGVDIPTKTTPVTSLKIGWWPITVSCMELDYSIAMIDGEIPLPRHPQASSGNSYLTTNPYTKYNLTIMPFGSVVIDPSNHVGSSVLKYSIDIDLITGMAILYLNIATDADEYWPISPIKGYVGVDVKLAQVASNYGGALMSVIGGSIGAAASSVTSGWANAIGTLTGAVGNAIENLIPSVSTTGGTGGIIDCYEWITLKSQFWLVVETSNSRLGSPLCKNRQISNIPGYIVVHDADFRASCTAQENVMIKDYMEGGFFYE